MKVKVDQELCTGCGLCVEICPEVYDWNDDGLAEAKGGTVPEESASDARDAAEDCPVEAIAVEE